MIRNTPILLLDEPSSGLDSGSEKAVFEALDRLMEGKTSVIIAHRLSTIRRADIIFVLKDGEIVERGNHDELMKRGGVYAELYDLQFRTDDAGVLRFLVAPGLYHLVSASPATWRRHAYWWNVPIWVHPGIGVVQLTTANASMSRPE